MIASAAAIRHHFTAALFHKKRKFRAFSAASTYLPLVGTADHPRGHGDLPFRGETNHQLRHSGEPIAPAN
jgi:hypothetical protein